MADMQVICPHCYAEIRDSAVECFSCGGVVLEKSLQHSTIELAGSPLQDWSYSAIPTGALLDNRFTIIQYNGELLEGHSYIVMDQVWVQRCFLILWTEQNLIWEYHRQICLRSPVVFSNDDPYYSAFPPQEGVPLQQALRELEWGTTKIWEVFRQLCFLLAPFHQDKKSFSYLHPEMLWIRNDGQLEFSLQRPELEVSWQVSSWQEEVRTLIRVLFWLFSGELEGEHWTVLPLKLLPIIRTAWQTPIPAGELWLRMDDAIRNKGYYSLPVEAKEWLQNVHLPNVIQVEDNFVQVPNSIQLCAWNCVQASWRLHSGRVLLFSDIMALYESGFVEHQNNVAIFEALRNFLLLDKQELTGIDLQSKAYILSEYGDVDQARTVIAEVMRTSRASADWIGIARLLFSIADPEEGWKCIGFAQKWAKDVPEKLEIAAFVRWELGAISEAKKYIVSWAEQIQDPQEMLWIAEAWRCLFSAQKRTNQFIQHAVQEAQKYSFSAQVKWLEMSLVRFGSEPFILQWLELLSQIISSEEELVVVQEFAGKMNVDPQWIAQLQIQEEILSEAEEAIEGATFEELDNSSIIIDEQPTVIEVPEETIPVPDVYSPAEEEREEASNKLWMVWVVGGLLLLYLVVEWLL